MTPPRKHPESRGTTVLAGDVGLRPMVNALTDAGRTNSLVERVPACFVGDDRLALSGAAHIALPSIMSTSKVHGEEMRSIHIAPSNCGGIRNEGCFANRVGPVGYESR